MEITAAIEQQERGTLQWLANWSARPPFWHIDAMPSRWQFLQ
jgi:hypothetical protein